MIPARGSGLRNACGANPAPIFVPCHRVLAAHQRLGGFSSGLHWKRKLLASERITLPLLEDAVKE
jgi:O-6-methylguanine DNA methyltransferase